MFRILLFLFLFPSLLFSESTVAKETEILNSLDTPLTTLYGVPETNIYGVNVINGNYNYASVDFNLPAADPMILQRSYSSSNYQSRAFYSHWTHNLSGAINAYVSSQHVHVVASGALTGEIPFKKKTKAINLNHQLTLNGQILSKGVTNCGSGMISGRNNIKNMKVIYDPFSGGLLKNSDGSEHLYCMIIPYNESTNESINILKRTTKLNGLVTTYDLADEHRLDNVKNLNSNGNAANTINFIHYNLDGVPFSDLGFKKLFKMKKELESFLMEATSKDKKTACYFFKLIKPHKKCPTDVNVLMTKFESSHLPWESYGYTDSNFGPEKLARLKGEHHQTEIDYYKKEDPVRLPGGSFETVSSDHIALGRVKTIRVAVKDSKDMQTLCRFAYFKNKSTKQAYTDVYQNKHFTRYRYSTRDYRLSCIERFQGTSLDSIYCKERLQFGDEKTPLEGDLLYKSVENSNGRIHFGENYDYDEHGNVLIHNAHYRQLTGAGIHPITPKSMRINGFFRGSLAGGEIKTTSFTYNHQNLPTSEENGRLKILLTYHGETDLLASKFMIEKGHTKRREFYEFDENAGCKLKIEDDGSGNSHKNLTNIHLRKVTRFKNRENTFAGLPTEIDEWGSSHWEKERRIARTVLKYNSHGYVEARERYNASNQLTYITQYVRDIQGNITDETDSLGQTTHRKYNLYGSLLEEHGPSLDYWTEYLYDFLQRPITEIRHCSDGINLTTHKKYDLEGRVRKTKDPYGASTEFIYNEQGLLVETIYPPIRTETGEWIRPREKKEYNFIGHLISETDPRGGLTLYSPNDAGQPLKITYPDKTVEKFRYSIYGELLEKIERNGSKIVYTYDAFSRPTSEKMYDSKGKLLKESNKEYSGLLLLSETDAAGLETTYSYNYAGKVSKSCKGNAKTEYFYDSLGRLKEERRYFGDNSEDYISTINKYDLLNRLTSTKEVDQKGIVHAKSKTTYYPDGNIKSTKTWTHAGEATTINTYDPRGNLSSSTDALGNITTYHTRYDHFFKGINLPCLEVTDPTGVKIITVYDYQGRLISEKIKAKKCLSKTEMFYDLSGNLVRKEQQLPNEMIVTIWRYDSSSRLIEQINGADTNEQIITRFTYNTYGELSDTHYADGTSKHYTYDKVGRLLEEWSNDKSIHYCYTYNQSNLPTVVRNCNTKKATIREYSIEGNLQSEEFENGLKIEYLYDRINRIKGCIYPDGSSVKLSYNPVFLEKTERIKSGSAVYEASLKKFDLSGKPKEVCFPKNSGTLSLEYDQLSRPKALSSPHYKEEQISYDSRGLLVSKIVNQDIQKFTHDDLQQLTLEETGLYSHTYENDSLHRQTSIDGQTQIHNALHQLTHGIHGQYRFDEKGRRTHDSDIEFTYDPFDRLVKVQRGDTIWSYTYDAFNRKMSRTLSDNTIYYLYDGHEEIGSYASDYRNIDLKVLSASEGSIPIAIELDSQDYTPIISSQGHIVGLVEMESGELADESFLTMFGKDLSETPLSPWRFCGKRHESDLGIIDFGYRFYHPKSSQWLTQDPLGESEGPNLYAYVKNNPTCCIDRFGLFMEDFDFCTSLRDISNSFCLAGNQVADYTIWSPRVMGAAQAFGGLSECAAGSLMALGGGAVAATGIGAPIGIGTICGGTLMASHGIDNFVTGFNQCWTGENQKTMTSHLLEQAGCSSNAAMLIEGTAGFKLNQLASRANATSSLVSNASKVTPGASNSICLGFTPQILEGNAKWGLNHILKRHEFGSQAKNAGKFLSGMGRDEISELVIEACRKNPAWKVADNGFLETTIDLGRIVGTKRYCGTPTSQIKVVLDGSKLHTMYPY